MKESQNHIADPWEIEIDLLIEKGMDPEFARVFVINSWMFMEDLRPLRTAIAQSSTLHEQTVAVLAKLIDEGRLTIKPPKGGRPHSPDKFSRDVFTAWLYEDELSAGKTSEQAFSSVAHRLCLTEDTVRKAVTWFRKNWNAQ